jgi:hypothetical protein
MLVLLLGCGDKQNPPGQPTDAGVDSGVDGGLDGGTDGGVDGGVDGGIPCINTVEPRVLDVRCHIGAVEGCETRPYTSNPPVSGPHYPIWASWRIHTQTVPRFYWVHNLEHGGVIFVYRPDAPQNLVDSIIRVFDAIPLDPNCVLEGYPSRRVVVTPDPLLDVPWAVTVSGPELPDGPGFGYYIKSDCIESEQKLVDFAVQHRDRSAEPSCFPGEYDP